MIHCDTEAERTVWAVYGVLARQRKPIVRAEIAELDGAFEAMYRSDGSGPLGRLPRPAGTRRKR